MIDTYIERIDTYTGRVDALLDDFEAFARLYYAVEAFCHDIIDQDLSVVLTRLSLGRDGVRRLWGDFVEGGLLPSIPVMGDTMTVEADTILHDVKRLSRLKELVYGLWPARTTLAMLAQAETILGSASRIDTLGLFLSIVRTRVVREGMGRFGLGAIDFTR